MRTSTRTRTLIVAVAAAALVLTALPPVPPVHAAGLRTALRPLAADDDVPGVPLDSYPIVSRTVTGTLDALPISLPPEDAVDLFSVYLAPGEQMHARLTGTPGTDFDLYLFSPDSVTFIAAHEVARSAAAGTSDESICYTASRRFGAGRYYLAVVTWNSEGAYQLDWHVAGRSDGNVPGRPLTASVATGAVDPYTDRDDVYALALAEGQSLTCTLTAESPAATVDLIVYPPVWNNGGILEPTLDVYHAGDAVAQRGSTITMTVTVPSGRGGIWYLDVRAVTPGTAYTLAWQAAVPDVPGTPLQSGAATGTLGASMVFAVPVRWGQRLTGSLWTSPTPAAASAWLFAPGTASTADTTTAAWASAWPASDQPKRFSWMFSSEADEGVAYLRMDSSPTPLFEQRVWKTVTSRRLSGADRYATAVRISQSGFRTGSDVVVVASGEGFPDALSAAGLAGAYDAPLLLVRKTALPDMVRQEIDRLGPSRVFVIGGPGAVSDAVVSALAARPSVRVVTRVSGADRYATSAEVARHVVSRLGPDFDGVVYVARGDTFPDALAVSPLAWNGRRPVLLTRSDALPSSGRAVLGELSPSEAVVVGGSGAVSGAVFGEVDALAETTRRVWGVDRYATAAAVAQDGVRTGTARPRFVALATGENFPDALAGGPLAGAEGGVLLLSKPTALSTSAQAFLASEKARVEACRLLGGTGALSDAVRSSADSVLWVTWPDDPPTWW
ncbi:cell wall-binding repeat-containing protein [Coriobacteriia bacterium Es71-Z0120]|uniref:cell wall-binding repeat-containing protein n=1 Tax=Parvivirga hydrogeniphila TaxID=2939460 RepID=UPI002260E619|nr:cell wall-binding repeat-containing protein [Parvivirga hydrogeniphila]MCL4078625.1 cell wall-binding repeat-containing protein [Parvivirga hydrogeniphila]